MKTTLLLVLKICWPFLDALASPGLVLVFHWLIHNFSFKSFFKTFSCWVDLSKIVSKNCLPCVPCDPCLPCPLVHPPASGACCFYVRNLQRVLQHCPASMEHLQNIPRNETSWVQHLPITVRVSKLMMKPLLWVLSGKQANKRSVTAAGHRSRAD